MLETYLPSSVAECDRYSFPVHGDGAGKLVVDGGGVCLWELLHHVPHEHAGLPNPAVAHDGTLEGLRSQTVDVGSDGRESGGLLGIEGICGSDAVDASH